MSCFGWENKNSRTFCRTFYSFHDDLLSKNMTRRQLDVNLTLKKVNMF